MSGKILRLSLELKTGENGRTDLPQIEFNGHLISLSGVEGNCQSGATLTGFIRPGSVAHTIRLVGPEQGAWDISSMRIDYEGETGSWTVDFVSFALDDETSADIFELPPLPTWDV